MPASGMTTGWRMIAGRTIAPIAAVAVLYATLGLIGLQLAVPPGYATIIWPASGMALAALLIFGQRLWPGVWIGSLAVNIVIGSSGDGSAPSLAALLIAAGIATGSTVQTVLAARLVKWKFGTPLAFDRAGDIVRFAILTGPLSCLVAPSVGVGTLVAADAVQPRNIVTNWLTWWTGDMMGILVVVPIALLCPWNNWSMLWKQRPVASLTPTMGMGLVVLLAATLAAWNVTLITTFERNQKAFEALAADSEQALEHRLKSYEQSLDGGAALFTASDEVSLPDWRAFVGQLHIERSLPGINGLGLIVPVRRDRLPQFLARMKQVGADIEGAHPDTGRDEMFVITYIEPKEINEQAVGLDIAFEDHRREAAIHARDSGRATITKRIFLVQDAEQTPGFLLLRPLYAKGAAPATAAERRAAFRGWIYAPFIARRFMGDLTASQGETLDIRIYDGRTVSEDRLIYASGGEPRAHPDYRVTKTISLMEQDWTVSWTSTPAFSAQTSSREPWLILAGGLCLTFMFAVLLLFYTRKQADISRQVELQTRELVAREKGLQEALEALGESEKRFSALAGLSPAGIFRTDPFGFCTFVNDAWLKTTGLSAQEALGSGWLGVIHPDDKDRVYARWMAAIGNAAELRTEFRLQRSGGATKWVDLLSVPELDEKGNQVGFIAVAIDNTDRKLAELAVAERDEQLAFLIDNMTDGVMHVSPEGETTYASPSMAELVGYSDEAIRSNQLGDFVHPEDREATRREYSKLLTGESERTIMSYRIVHGVTRRWTWLEAHGASVRDPQTGELTGYIVALRNVDEHKRLQREIREALDRAEAATRSKSEFLANMSHEIRTPMNGVIGFTELLLAGNLDETQRKQLNLVLESSRAMMNLLNDILDLSKIEAGRLQIVAEPVDLRAELTRWVGQLEPVAVQKDLPVELHIEPSLPDAVMADPVRLRQIVFNLLGNAIKFTESGHVSVSARRFDDTIVIEVADSGIGIEESLQATIFDQFVQAEVASNRKYAGTGLGLAIANELARLMCGQLTLVSQPGLGTTVTLEIPFDPVDTALPLEQHTQGPQVPEEIDGSARILLVEDHDINRELVTQMLETIGYRPDMAVNGEEAVTKIERAAADGRPYALVFMDIRMPVLDGLDATRRIRARGIGPAELPIVALSANAYPEDVAACIEAGMQSHIAKPVRLRDLRAALDRWLNPVEAVVEERPAEPAAPAAAARLAGKYLERRDETLAILEDAAAAEPKEASWDEVIGKLHKLAGTAGLFGDAELGKLAGALERELKALEPAEQKASVRRALSGFRQLVEASRVNASRRAA